MNIEREKHIIFRYTLVGILFGCLFPIGAILFEVIRFELPLNIHTVELLHKSVPLLLMIDTAPLFLGIFAFVAGVIRNRLEDSNIELEMLANKDDLTDTYNRRFGHYRIEQMIAKHKKDNSEFALIFIDLDRFKYINDTAGHEYGDEVLKILASRLHSLVRDEKNLIRLGGDEFMILCENTKLLSQQLDDIVKRVEMPIMVKDKHFLLKASIGISICPEHGDKVSELLRYAYIAMYHCKKTFKSPYCIFKEDMLEDMEETVRISNALEIALEKDEFELVYQPIYDTSGENLYAAEALLRWDCKNLDEKIPPSVFIPIAEQSGVIIEIGYWVIESVCRLLSTCNERKNVPVISINISGVQLRDDIFVDRVEHIVKEYGIKPHEIKFEITESVSMEEISHSKSVFKKLKESGFRLSMDDFGTGHSSLAELRKMMIDYIKIDKSFIDDIHVDVSNDLIVSAMIAMAKGLQINVIAEGVEEESQLEYLKEQGCDYIQGYLFSKPISESEFIKLCKSKCKEGE
ncbi:MAG: bifunctional diguanylate cyclase/phosphodiesterase [Tissierellales bacterium]|jgi:diguanylate cyclase (GGDEF)-like protein|nr:bifunctional diguanylate cyclase/phosphodiesterase [Tissierellales bacterium]